MKNTRSGVHFFGALAEPVHLRPGRTLLEDENEQWQDAVIRAREKLPLVADWYGAPKYRAQQTNWREVCFRLAFDFVPGFRIVAPRPERREPGRPAMAPDWRLLEAVAKIRSRRPMKVASACVHLANKAPWRGKTADALRVEHGRKLKAFRKMYGFDYGSPAHNADWSARQAKRTLLSD